jgi:DNA invertase Pin-like site-specific DNA recombinase
MNSAHPYTPSVTAVVYARIASNEPDAYSKIGAQQAMCEEYATTLGYQVIKCYSDVGTTRANRDKMLARLGDPDAEPVTAVFVTRLDRLTRKTSEARQILDRLSDTGVRLHSCRDLTRHGIGDLFEPQVIDLAVYKFFAAWEAEHAVQHRPRA